LRLFRGAIGVLAALKAVDLAAALPQETDGSVAYPLLALWVAGALLLIIDRRPSLGAGAVAASGTAIIFTTPGLYYSHFYLLVVVAVVLALFAQEHQRTLLRAQLSIVYGFGALTKVNGTYLSGEVLEVWLARSPLFGGLALPTWMLVSAAVLSVLCEGFLAVGLWFVRTRVVAVVVGIAFHAGILIAVPDGPTLAIYAGTMFALYWLFFDPAERPDEVEPCALGLSSSGTTGGISGAGPARP